MSKTATSDPYPPNTRRTARVVGLLALFLAIALPIWLHEQAGLTLPLPVGDEVVFYYPALAFAQHGTLQSPHLHETRALFWMPPGYMLLLSGWLKTIGEGLLQARTFSLILAMLAFASWARLAQRWNLALTGLALLFVCSVSRHWVVMGNMVRMEALELLLWGLGLFALDKGRRWASLSWFLLSVCVHPNGAYFCLYWAGTQAIDLYRKKENGSGFTRGWQNALPGVLGAAAYGIYAFLNWDAFLHDWQYQLATRQVGGTALLLFRADQAVFGVMWLGCIGVITWKKEFRFLLKPLSVAGTLWLIRVLGQGWSYGVFNILAVTITASIALKLFNALVLMPRIRNFQFRKALQGIAAGAVILALIGAKVYSLPGLWRTYEWQGMWPEANFRENYWQDSHDRSIIRNRLHDSCQPFVQKHGRPALVYFLPAADAILAGNSEPGVWSNLLPTFDGRLPDFIVWHRAERGTFFDYTPGEMATVCRVDTLTPFHESTWPFADASECTDGCFDRWYLVDLKGKRAEFTLPAAARNDP